MTFYLFFLFIYTATNPFIKTRFLKMIFISILARIKNFVAILSNFLNVFQHFAKKIMKKQCVGFKPLFANVSMQLQFKLKKNQ